MKIISRFFVYGLFFAAAVTGFAQQFQIGSVAVANPTTGNPNVYPSNGTESPSNAIDGTVNKYLNFGKLNTGYIFTLASSATAIATGINFTTANDSTNRDPTTVSIYGSNNPADAASTTAGKLYDLSDFTPITLNLALPASATRNLALGNTLFSNSTAYNTYLVVFPTVSDASTANSMQLGEAELTSNSGGTIVTTASSGTIAGGQVIPEPGSLALAAASSLLLLRRRRMT